MPDKERLLFGVDGFVTFLISRGSPGAGRRISALGYWLDCPRLTAQRETISALLRQQPKREKKKPPFRDWIPLSHIYELKSLFWFLKKQFFRIPKDSKHWIFPLLTHFFTYFIQRHCWQRHSEQLKIRRREGNKMQGVRVFSLRWCMGSGFLSAPARSTSENSFLFFFFYYRGSEAPPKVILMRVFFFCVLVVKCTLSKRMCPHSKIPHRVLLCFRLVTPG